MNVPQTPAQKLAQAFVRAKMEHNTRELREAIIGIRASIRLLQDWSSEMDDADRIANDGYICISKLLPFHGSLMMDVELFTLVKAVVESDNLPYTDGQKGAVAEIFAMMQLLHQSIEYKQKNPNFLVDKGIDEVKDLIAAMVTLYELTLADKMPKHEGATFADAAMAVAATVGFMAERFAPSSDEEEG